MIAAAIANKADIDRVVFDEAIYDRISGDGCPARHEFQVPYDLGTYIGGYMHGAIAALYIINPDGERIHFMVLPEYRRYGRELLQACMKLWPHPVSAEIPSLYPEVVNFARKAGFLEVGIKPGAHMKNGRTYDTHILRHEVS